MVSGVVVHNCTGNGPQPTNFPNSGPEVRQCAECGRWHPAERVACPWCFQLRGPLSKAEEWNAAAAEDGLAAIATRDLDFVEGIWGDALAVMGGSLRSLLCTDEEHEFICSDYSAIEAVVNAMLAGEQWRIDVFRTHGKIYEASAAETFKVPLAEILDYKQQTGNHHPLRKKGKVTELACFPAETQVLTDSGYKAIVDVLKTDKLWDGVEWVSHAGVISKGRRDVLALDGIETTPEHKMLCGTSWLAAKSLASNESILSQSLATGSANLPSFASTEGTAELGTQAVSAPAATLPAPPLPTSRRVQPLGAPSAASSPRMPPGEESSQLGCPNQPSAGYTLGSTLRSAGAITPSAKGTRTTGAGGSQSTPSGGMTVGSSSPTSSPLMAGTPPASTWTESTTIGGMSPETCASSREWKTQRIEGRWPTLKPESLSSKPVYDIAFAGPRSRYTIKTSSGHLIVHNCGFLGWIGAIRQMGGYEGTDAEARDLILRWRAASPNIVFLGGGQSCPQSTQQWHLAALAAGGATNAGPEWELSRARADGVPPWKGVPYMHGLEGMTVLAIQNPETQYPVMRLDGTFSGLTMYVHDDVLYMFLPDGSYIPYHKPRLQSGKDDWRGLQISYEGYNTNPKMGAYGWCVMTTYSGKLLENACQATANRILRHGQHRLEAAGYPVVLHVYDENAAEVPKGFGSIEQFEAEMNVMPPWAADWPIKAKGGWRGRRYRK